MSSVARHYYERCIGQWSGDFELRLTKSEGAPIALRMMALFSKLFGNARMATTVFRRDDDFLHTTRLSKLGVTLMKSEETIVICADGASVRMSGTQNGTAYEATATVDEDSDGARYEIPWMDLTIIQKTKLLEEGRLELVQETAFSRASAVLARITR